MQDLTERFIPLLRTILALAEKQRHALDEGNPEKALSLQRCRDRLVGAMRAPSLHASAGPPKEDRRQMDLLVRRISQVDGEIQRLTRNEQKRLQGRIHRIHRIRSVLRGGLPHLPQGKGVHVTA